MIKILVSESENFKETQLFCIVYSGREVAEDLVDLLNNEDFRDVYFKLDK